MADNFDFRDDMILPDDFDPNDPAANEYDPNFVADNSADNFFTEEAAGENGAQEESVQPDAVEPTTVPDAQSYTAPPTIRVRFNHEDRELSYDEAAMYAQKGMNYDKLEQRVKGYEALNEKMSRLARNLEYETPEEMIDAAENNFRERQVRRLVEDGNTEAMARFLVDQQAKATAAESAPQTPPPQEVPSPAPQRPSLTPERKAELDEFIRAYPGVTKLPDEVIRANAQGVRLLVAYERYVNRDALRERAILKQNQASAAKAPVTGVAGRSASAQGTPEEDPFLKGFSSY